MDQDAHPFVFRVRTLGEAEMEGEGVDEGAGEMPVTGMDDHARGFVDYQHVLILVHDVQGDVFRQDFDAPPLIGHDEPDHVAGADDRVRLGGLVIDQDVSVLDGQLDPVSGGAFQMGGEVFVDPDGRLSLVGDQPEMLEHFPAFRVLLGQEIGFFRQVVVQEFRHFFWGSLPSSRVKYRLTWEPSVFEVPTSSCL